MDTAQIVSDAGAVAEPEAVRITPALPGPYEATVADAYTAVKAKCDPGITYDIAFVNDDGAMFRRFSRKTPVEAWLRARPINTETGRTLLTESSVVFPLAVSMATYHDVCDTLAEQYVAELEALKAADDV